MEASLAASVNKPLPFTPLDRRLHAGGAPAGTRFERHTKPSSWKALSLRRPYLCALLALSLVLLGGIEALRQISNRRHGLQHLGGLDPTTLTTGQNILYSYIPTVVAVLYSILWSYIDSDTKRLEPYIQMRSGRSPAAILLLDYVFESALATTLRALRRRHWTLAAVSFTFLLVSIILPASQGALFGIDSVSYLINDVSFDSSHTHLVYGTLPGGEFIDQAGAISTPNGSNLPPWTTTDYAISAFSPKTLSTGGNNQTWTAGTIVYYAQPSCRKFEVEQKISYDGGGSGLVVGAELFIAHDILLLANISITEDPSCDLTVSILIRMFEPLSQDEYLFPIFTYASSGIDGNRTISGITAVAVHTPEPGDTRYQIIQSGSNTIYWRDPANSCPNRARLAGLVALNFSHFNGTWKQDLSNIDSSIALYACEGTCSWATARVTADADTQAIISIDQLMNHTTFSNEDFNVSVFESYLEIGRLQPEDLLNANASSPGLWAIAHTQSLGEIVARNLSSRVDHQSSYSTLFIDDQVGNAFEAGYRLIFALMFNGFLKLPATQGTVTGTVQVDSFAVIVVPAFAILSETILAIAAVVLIGLVLGYHRRTSILRSDPDSIAAQCSIIVDEFNDVGIMRSSTRRLDSLSTKKLEEQISTSHLEYHEQSGYLRLVTPEQEMTLLTGPLPSSAKEPLTDCDPLPFFMRKRGIVLAVTALLALLAALVFLVAWSHIHRGFDYLTNSLSFRSQLFWSFMPTLFATVIETGWVSLHRDLSVLETWVAIRKRHTRAQDSLSLRYSSRPPSLVLWMAFKRRHFMLSFVSCLCLTTSILNIAMAGLFLNSIEDFTSSVDNLSQYTSAMLPGEWFDSNDVNRAFSVLRAELTDDGGLPGWTNHDLSFVPISSTASVPMSPDSGDSIFTSTTSAIGSSLACVHLPNQATVDASGPGIYTDNQGIQSVRFKPANTTVNYDQTCAATYDFPDTVESIFFQVMDLLDLTTGSTSNLDDDGCGNLILVVSGVAVTHNISFHVCSSSVSISDVEVKYTTDQVIVSHQTNSTSSHGAAILGNEVNLLSFYRRKFMEAATFSHGLGPTTEYDWPGLLMTRIRNDSNVQSIPELADDVWRRVFAIWFSIYRRNLLTTRNSTDASPSAATGTVMFQQSRIMPSIPAFVVSISLIFIYLVSFIVVVRRRQHRYTGPRMPKTIGSIMPWVIHSRMLEDFMGVHYVSSRDRDDALQRMDRRYGFGRFRGRHGKVTLGIEYEELLMARGAYGDF